MSREEFIALFRWEIMGVIYDGWKAGNKETGTERAWRLEMLDTDAERILGKAFDELQKAKVDESQRSKLDQLQKAKNGILRMPEKRRTADGEL